MNSLKIAVEDWAIGAAQTYGQALAGIQCAHVDGSSNASQERLIFSATVGPQELQGARYYPTDLNVELRNSNRNASASDIIFAAVEAMFMGMSSDVNYGAAEYFTELIFFPEEMDSKADRSDNSRIRSRTFPFRVVGIAPSNAILVIDDSGIAVEDDAGILVTT